MQVRGEGDEMLVGRSIVEWNGREESKRKGKKDKNSI